MTKNEYLNKLKSELGSMAYKDVSEILSDIEGHFEASIANGKTEEETCEHLGDPAQLAREYKEGMDLNDILKRKEKKVSNPKAQEPTTGTVMFCVLLTLFVAIPSWVALLGIVVTMVLIEIAIAAGAIALLIACWTFGSFIVSGLFAGLTLLFLGIFGYALCYFSIKYFAIGTKWYIGYMKKTWHEGI